MENSLNFGLIGKNISYSFSKKYFENKFKNLMLHHYKYQVFDLQNLDEVSKIFEDENLRGLNVTIPYKQKIIAHLDELSEEAEKTGAVNCILVKDGIKKGYNTDTFGFERTLLLHQKKIHKKALILGNGGAAKAVEYVLNKHELPYLIISRNSEINFEILDEETVRNHEIIIQCTPVGTFPDVENCLYFPFEGLGKNHLVIDLIYNPNYTKFIKNAAEKGTKTVNGLYMLEQQAEKSWQIWNY